MGSVVPGIADPQGGPAGMKPSVAPEAIDTMLVQVFLNNANFGPGLVDGQADEFTRKAIIRYQKANGLPPDGNPKSLPLSTTEPSTVDYEVTAADASQIGSAPKQPGKQAQQQWLPYASVVELLAEKFHTSQDFLRKVNPQLKGRDARAGDILKVPHVTPFDIANVEAKQTEKESPSAPESAQGKWIDVDVGEKMLEVKDGDKTVAAFPITPGSSTLPAPKGHWHVESINYMPIFRYDKEMLYHGRRSKSGIATPRGPNSKVGVVWMSLNKTGVGIHGTDEPETIGHATSHGCIRLANWDAVKVAEMIQPGTKVIIH